VSAVVVQADPWNSLTQAQKEALYRTSDAPTFGERCNQAAAIWRAATPRQQEKWLVAYARQAEKHGEVPTLFHRYTMAELLAEPSEFEWLAAGLFADPTYGQIAGEMKTLKSYVTGFIEVGIATGQPIFGHFAPPAPRPVLAYVGEGGRRLWTRRIRRICSAMGTTPAMIDLHPSFDVAPIASQTFQESLHRDLDDLQPGLVTLDPLYTYHGAETRAADLHQEGALLNQLSGPCMNAGASLAVVNHFNQTGSGAGLKRITMAGSGEWADSWVLIAHREQPDVDAGLFHLTLEIGSRQWGGTSWDLDLSIGRFDVETGSHDGEITWDLNRSSGSRAKTAESSVKVDRAEQRIVDAVADDPWGMTKTEIKVAVGGSRDVFEIAFGNLAGRGVIDHSERGREESGTVKKRLLWGQSDNQGGIRPPGLEER
jgi:hypothetical protein